MPILSTTDYPKLRPLDIRPHTQSGQAYILLRDPSQICDKSLLVPQPLAAAVAFCDGEHDTQAIYAAFQQHYGVALPLVWLEQLIHALDDALLLENEHTALARTQVLAAYRQAPFRTPTLAGQAYPAQSSALRQLFQSYLETVPDEQSVLSTARLPAVAGLLSPHIDYRRGGPVYAQVWKHAAALVKDVDLVVMFGTDHYGSDPFTLTRQNYATPYGVLPTDQTVVDALTDAIGEEAAFAGELRHRGEHSLELVLTWLHHMRAGESCKLVPILCGGFHRFIYDGTNPAADPLLNRVFDALHTTTQGRRVAVIASGDLSHVGPAFGGEPLNLDSRARLRTADDELIKHMCGGSAEDFFKSIRTVRDHNNVCGVAPIYLTMRLLEAQRGECTGYATCPADEYDTSVVTVCGILFS